MRVKSIVLSLAFMLAMSHTTFSDMKITDFTYPHAFDIHKKDLKKDGTIFVHYKVIEKYPSKKVYDFYRDLLKKHNFKEVDWKNQNLGVWFSFIDDTKKDHPIIHELRAIWSDEKKEMMYILSLRYYSKFGKNYPDNDIQHVYFQQRPYLKQ